MSAGELIVNVFAAIGAANVLILAVGCALVGLGVLHEAREAPEPEYAGNDSDKHDPDIIPIRTAPSERRGFHTQQGA